MSSCGNLTRLFKADDDFEAVVTFLRSVMWWHGSYGNEVMLVTCCVALAVNGLTFAVLTRPCMRCVVNGLLAVIALCNAALTVSQLVPVLRHYYVNTIGATIVTLKSSGTACTLLPVPSRVFIIFIYVHQLFNVHVYTMTLWLAVLLAGYRLTAVSNKYLKLHRRLSQGKTVGVLIVLTALVIAALLVPFLFLSTWKKRVYVTDCGSEYWMHSGYMMVMTGSCAWIRVCLALMGVAFKLLPCLALSVGLVLLVYHFRRAWKRHEMLTRNANAALTMQQQRLQRQQGNNGTKPSSDTRLFMQNVRQRCSQRLGGRRHNQSERRSRGQLRQRQKSCPDTSSALILDSQLVLETDRESFSSEMSGGPAAAAPSDRARRTTSTASQQQAPPSPQPLPTVFGKRQSLAPSTTSVTERTSDVASPFQSKPGSARNRLGQRRTSVTLLAVLALILVCELPQACASILAALYPGDVYLQLYPILGPLFDLLSTLSGIVTFVLYCTTSAAFRSTFHSMVCCRSTTPSFAAPAATAAGRHSRRRMTMSPRASSRFNSRHTRVTRFSIR